MGGKKSTDWKNQKKKGETPTGRAPRAVTKTGGCKPERHLQDKKKKKKTIKTGEGQGSRRVNRECKDARKSEKRIGGRTKKQKDRARTKKRGKIQPGLSVTDGTNALRN